MPKESSGAPDVVGKALALLSRLGDHPDGAPAAELARQVGFPLSTAHRLLGALVREGFASFDATTKRYKLGLHLFALAQQALHSRGFSGMARSILEEVSSVTREATLLAVRDGEEQLYVFSIEGPQQVRVVGEAGRHGPLHCTSQGKVLVAFAEPATREYLVANLPLPAAGPRAITSRQKFRSEIELVRTAGHAIADEEHEAGIRAIGVPVLNHDGVAVAAIATAAPAYRMTVEQLEALLPTLHEAAAAVGVLMALQ